MATREELIAGLRAADAAGNVEDALVFADALRAMNQTGQHTTPPADVAPFLKEVGSGIAGAVGSMGTGAAKVLAGLEGIPMDLLVGLRNATEGGPFADPQKFPDIKDPVGGSSDLIRRAEKNLYVPETPTEKRIEAVSRGAFGMASPGVSGKGAVLGALSGGAGQAAREYFPDSKTAPVIAELATLLAGTPALSTPRTVKTVKKVVDEIGTNELQRMKVAQAEASAILGTPTIASHFGPENTGLTALVKEISNSPEGGPLREALRGEARGMAREQAALPGEITPQTTFTQADANQAARAVSTAKQAPFKELSREVKPYYEAAKGEMVPKPIVDRLVEMLMGIPGKMGLDRTGPAASKVESYAMRVKNAGDKIPAKAEVPPSTFLGPDGKPVNPGSPAIPEMNLPPSAAELDSVGKGARTSAKTADSKYNVDSNSKEAGAAMHEVHRVIREIVAGSDKAPGFSANLREGKRIYTEGMEALKPWSEGPLNNLFSKGVLKGKDNAQFDSSMKWLRNPNTAAEDVKFVGEQVRKSNPDEFRMLVGQNVMHAAQNSPNPQEFVKALIGEADTAATRQGAFRESINQAALASGKNPAEAAEAADGALKLLETLRTVAKGHENVRGSVQTNVAALAGENKASMLLRVLNPIGLYIRAWAEAGPIENAFRNRVFRSLSTTLSTPEGIDRLIEISKFDPVKHKSAILGRGLMGVNLQQD
jgi:hypothetical protein